MSVPGHALRCGLETSVTSPLRWLWFELSGHEKTYSQSSRPWECGNPEGISKECGKGGKPASWLSILCHFHGLLFAQQCWVNRYATQRNAPHPPRNPYRDRLSVSASAMMHQSRSIPDEGRVYEDPSFGLRTNGIKLSTSRLATGTSKSLIKINQTTKRPMLNTWE
jgi:hypothetical protein